MANNNKETKLYDVLGVSPRCTQEELKRAYCEMASKYDWGKNTATEEIFKEIAYAFNILSDPEKRYAYDHGGEQASQGRSEILRELEHCRERLHRMLHAKCGGWSKPEDVVFRLEVSLEDMYNGAIKRISIKKNKTCSNCSGRGYNGAIQKCSDCRETGFYVVVQQFGPGILQPIQCLCHVCCGQGVYINSTDLCAVCHGNSIVEDNECVEVHIEKGMVQGQRIALAGKGNQYDGMHPGDIIVILLAKNHDVFRRQNQDLVMDMKISLVESLCGFKKVVKTLDGRQIVITSNPGKVIKYGDVKCVMGEGMPAHRDSFIQKGRLFVQFTVDFPANNWISRFDLKSLEMLLPPRREESFPDDTEHVDLTEFDPNVKNRSMRNEAYYDDNSEH